MGKAPFGPKDLKQATKGMTPQNNPSKPDHSKPWKMGENKNAGYNNLSNAPKIGQRASVGDGEMKQGVKPPENEEPHYNNEDEPHYNNEDEPHYNNEDEPHYNNMTSEEKGNNQIAAMPKRPTGGKSGGFGPKDLKKANRNG